MRIDWGHVYEIAEGQAAKFRNLSREERQDAAAEAVRRALVNCGEGRQPGEIVNYVIRSTRTACLDQLRYRRRHPSEGEPNEFIVDRWDWVWTDAKMDLAAAVEELPKMRREIVRMLAQEMTYEDISIQLSIPITRVKSQARRVREMIGGCEPQPSAARRGV